MDFAAALNKSDSNGNRLSLSKGGSLSLFLKSEGVSRALGDLGETAKGTPFYDKVVKESNRFRKTDSWGLNWDVLEALPSETVIRLRSEKATYMIKAGDARAHGDFLWFKTQGFERQSFIPISFFSVS